MPLASTTGPVRAAQETGTRPFRRRSAGHQRGHRPASVALHQIRRRFPSSCLDFSRPTSGRRPTAGHDQAIAGQFIYVDQSGRAEVGAAGTLGTGRNRRSRPPARARRSPARSRGACQISSTLHDPDAVPGTGRSMLRRCSRQVLRAGDERPSDEPGLRRATSDR